MRLKGGFQALGLPIILASILFSIIPYIIPTHNYYSSCHVLFQYPYCLGSRVLRPRIELQIVGFGVILGLYWDNGEENGSYYSMLGSYWDNGTVGACIYGRLKFV